MTVNIVFYIFAALTIIGALLVVSSRNPVRAVIAKVFTFFAAAGVWITMQQEYLALLLIVIYVGAVLVMFLFVVMMIDIDVATKQKKLVFYWPVVILLCAVLAVLISILVSHTFAGSMLSGGHGTVRALGEEMFSDGYLYAFELAAMVLLAAMVAAITLTFRGKKPGNKSINPAIQIKTDPNERLTMIKMNAEKKQNKQDKGASNDD
ncbi:NADH-quinone oxidoreductase subunit J [Fangia hongkongensis]|uniref:NADH-quinone oxidoreductase subunit J n=1 Tax=Fangia hongkongensis TaxID=270495 RepID=UPI00036BC390|nr:NADH-quinone oxidoreductase subunit J [Fangia hongkongensis]MBK2125623.1 NADH-quinone oxidoreductase subunit J [Fangia hongkongensis]